MFKSIITALCVLCIMAGCRQKDTSKAQPEEKVVANPAADGFNETGSDPEAVAIADSVMRAMGGRQNWDRTKIISWNFFGRRIHTWNKQSGRDRLEIPAQKLVIDFNTNSKKGTVIKDGEKMTQPDSLNKYLEQAYQLWVNDSYWLLMPYKLKDTGVTLNYMGADSMQTGEPAYKLKLTFDNIGVTPENMYYVYVDTTDYMVRQWAYYPKADMQEPGFVLPWKEYKNYGGIMLSGNRGTYTLSDIKVMDQWPDSK